MGAPIIIVDLYRVRFFVSPPLLLLGARHGAGQRGGDESFSLGSQGRGKFPDLREAL